eukprot:scaffold3818_cov132-Isochrysis_galbana.AAC.1
MLFVSLLGGAAETARLARTLALGVAGTRLEERPHVRRRGYYCHIAGRLEMCRARQLLQYSTASFL